MAEIRDLESKSTGSHLATFGMGRQVGSILSILTQFWIPIMGRERKIVYRHPSWREQEGNINIIL